MAPTPPRFGRRTRRSGACAAVVACLVGAGICSDVAWPRGTDVAVGREFTFEAIDGVEVAWPVARPIDPPRPAPPSAGAPKDPTTSVAPKPATPSTTPPVEPEEVLDFFHGRAAPKLRLILTPGEYAKLERDPRVYVRATLQEGEKTVYRDVGIKLKGSAGSFRALDSKPGFTVKLDKFVKDQEFHGLSKFHLNNSVQDATFLSEFLGCEAFRAGGIPAPLVSHARVAINGRDLGIYVFKESYDKKFVKRHFADAEGELYDGGFCQDIDAGLEQDSGKADPTGGGLQDLVAACQEPDPDRRRRLVEARLDVPEFLTFMALERMLCHWDGYCMNRNNYRVYVPTNGKVVFLPHGMDQLLGDTGVSMFDEPAAIVAGAVFKDAEWAAAYRRRIGELLPIFKPLEKLMKLCDEELARVRPVSGGAPSAPNGSASLKSRLARRVRNLEEQLAQPAPKPVDIDKGESFRINNWRPVSEAGGAKLAQVTFANERVLRVQAGVGPSVGSWRTRVLLLPGKYRFEASVRTDDVVPAAGPTAGGAGIVVAGAAESPHLVDAPAWKPLRLEFEVVGTPRNVEFAVELRATKGSAVFRLSSLRILRTD